MANGIELRPTEETPQITCGACDTEFSVVLTPDYRPLGTERAMKDGGVAPVEIKFCPVCGEEELAV